MIFCFCHAAKILHWYSHVIAEAIMALYRRLIFKIESFFYHEKEIASLVQEISLYVVQEISLYPPE
jgi:hypothetical protein